LLNTKLDCEKIVNNQIGSLMIKLVYLRRISQIS